MVSSFFSRSARRSGSSRDGEGSALPSASSTSEHSYMNVMHESLERWRRELDALTVEDAGGEGAPKLTLAQAHPGGLAQLYAEKTTKLSNLVRESGAYERAKVRAQAILKRSQQLSGTHGMGLIHLAVGQASWTGDDGVRRGSPALLLPIDVEENEEGDILLTLMRGAAIGSALAHALAAYHVVVNTDDILSQGFTAHAFSPSKALGRVESVSKVLERCDIRQDLVLGIFEHPASLLLDEYEQPDRLLAGQIVRALAGDEVARREIREPLPAPHPSDRDPWEEHGVGGLNPRQQDIVEAVSCGRSLIIDVPHGGDDLPVLASILIDAASRGRSVVHVAGAPSRTARVEAQLSELGLSEIATRIDIARDNPEKVGTRFLRAIEDTSDMISDMSQIEQMRADLKSLREALLGYTTALHHPFSSFGVRPYDALRVLTRLSGEYPSPTTKVRFSENVLLDIARDQAVRVRDLLHQADDLAIFASSAASSPWDDAFIDSDDRVDQIIDIVERLAYESFPKMRLHMRAVAEDISLTPAKTPREWEQQLQVFQELLPVWNVFVPDIFRRSAADMVIATATKQWRRDHGVSMSRPERNRLITQARSLLRPGVHVDDLHQKLLDVQKARELWRKNSGSDTWPSLPNHFDEMRDLTESVHSDLDQLGSVLGDKDPDLWGIPVGALCDLVEKLVGDTQRARELPQRVKILAELGRFGLGEFVADMRQRQVSRNMLDTELDLAWWASLLNLMLTTEPLLGGFDPTRLEHMLNLGRDLDAYQSESLAPIALQRLRALRRQVMAARSQEVNDLMKALRTGISGTQLYSTHRLASHLVPVVLSAPTLVPAFLPPNHQVDLLILDDIDSLPLGELIPLIARAQQVVVLADLSATQIAKKTGNGSSEGATPSKLTLSLLSDVLPHMSLDVIPETINDYVAAFLEQYGVGQLRVPLPWKTHASTMQMIWADGSGMPVSGATAIESSLAEVDVVVQQVIAHAMHYPNESAAVIALNELHAIRIRAAIKRELEKWPELVSFFDSHVAEPFVVTDPEKIRGLIRDHVIISYGYAKTPHGRVLHDFGVFSRPEGLNALTDILRTIRSNLTLISSIHPDEVDSSRLSSGGARMLIDLLRMVDSVSTPVVSTDVQEPVSIQDQGEYDGVRVQPELASLTNDEGMDTGKPWPVTDEAPDPLLIDLAERLHAMGLDVVPNLGVAGGMRIPLAVGHPEVPGRLLVAVLTDDDDYVDELSQRVRDRLWPERLESLGWKVCTELSMPVFIDPERETEKIVQLVLDAVDEFRIYAEQLSYSNDLQAESLNGSDGHSLDAADEGNLSENDDAPVDLNNDGERTSFDDARVRADEMALDMTATMRRIEAEDARRIREEEGEAHSVFPIPVRNERPAIAKGLPLSAYGDDQLDELAEWVRSDGADRSEDENVEQLRIALGMTRRGAQTDAVLRHVIRRTEGLADFEGPGETEEPV